MAMAHRAPNPIYVRKHLIAPHAIERLRERLTKNSIDYRDDDDIGNRIDEAVSGARAQGTEEHFADLENAGVHSILVDLSDHLQDGAGLHAILRVNQTKSRANPQEWVVVTLLTKKMVDNNRTHKRWVGWVDSKDADAFFAAKAAAAEPSLGKLGDKLAGLTGTVVPSMPGMPTAPAQPAFNIPAHALPPAKPVEMRLVRYVQVDGVVRVELYALSDVTAVINALAEDPKVQPGSIEVWRRQTLKTRIELSE